MTPEEYQFRQLEAKRYKASLSLSGRRAVIYMEDKNDKEFWSSVLKHYKPEATFYFVYGSRTSGSGCQQCFKYKDFLDEKFLIAVDSDFRYLMQEKEISAMHYVLQTYTYSFENHYCYKDNLQGALRRSCEDDSVDLIFSFPRFVEEFSEIIYPLFVYLLHCIRVNNKNFTREEFRDVLSGMIKVDGSIAENGKKILDVLRERVEIQLEQIKSKEKTFSSETEAYLHEVLGLNKKTTDLYLRGHDMFRILVSQGREVVKSHIRYEKQKAGEEQYRVVLAKHHSFEKELLSNLIYSYPEIEKIGKDIQDVLG